MKRITALFLFLFLLPMLVAARENPFLPPDKNAKQHQTTNIEPAKKVFGSAQIALPSTARLVRKVTVEFQNLDGSIEKKILQLEDEIDWHYPLLITQSPKAKVALEVKPEKEIETDLQQSQPLAKKPKKALKKELKKSSKSKKEIASKTLASSSFSFVINQKNITIKTQKEMLRSFALSEPNRIVVDFSKIGDVKNGSVKYQNGIVKEIKVGNNDGFARVVIELDGQYVHELHKTPSGYIVVLR